MRRVVEVDRFLVKSVYKYTPTSEYFQGWFQGWAGLSEHPLAIVELPDGHIILVNAEGIQFMPAGKIVGIGERDE